MSKKILISALETSANLHLEQILKNFKDVQLAGIFDSSFGNPIMDSSEFNSMGFIGVLPLIFKAKKALQQMLELAKTSDIVLLIDSPAFNIPLAKAIKKLDLNIKIIYYILPKVWAWKAKKVEVLEKNCDILASIFPFESQFFQKSVYVGNPLLDEIKFQKKVLSKNNIIAFLPGSRLNEIVKLMPIFKKLAIKFKQKKLLCVPKNFLNKITEIYGNVDEFEIVSDTPKALDMSDFAFICSGTATLQAALIGTPFVLCYKANFIDFMIAKAFVKIKYIGLANILFDFMNKEPFHDEIIYNVSAEKLFLSYQQTDCTKFIECAQNLRQYLSNGSAENLSKIIKEII